MNETDQINQIFKDFNGLKALVIGDVMIDAYYKGQVDRISPEAPVPIVAVTAHESRLGGAANVALNVAALGAAPILCSVIGDDDQGQVFMNRLDVNGMSSEGIVKSTERITTVKTRIIGNNHQMLRVDEEMDEVLSEEDTNALYERIEQIVKGGDVNVIIFEDYDKGVLNDDLIRKVVKLANSHGIPTTADPKKRNYFSYEGVTLFKPNLKELKEGLQIEFDQNKAEELEGAINQLHEKLKVSMTFVTLSEKGVYIKTNEVRHHIEAHLRNISDVSGAGDTVISVASLCVALGLPPLLIASLSNLAGGMVCEKVGVVPIEKDALKVEALALI